MLAPNITGRCPVPAAQFVTYRLDGDPTIRVDRAGSLAWRGITEGGLTVRVAEWAPVSALAAAIDEERHAWGASKARTRATARIVAGTWRTGAPPTVGWWVASIVPDSNVRRWWDGCEWSAPCTAQDPAELIEAAKHSPSVAPLDAMHWRPVTSREPRRPGWRCAAGR